MPEGAHHAKTDNKAWWTSIGATTATLATMELPLLLHHSLLFNKQCHVFDNNDGNVNLDMIMSEVVVNPYMELCSSSWALEKSMVDPKTDTTTLDSTYHPTRMLSISSPMNLCTIPMEVRSSVIQRVVVNRLLSGTYLDPYCTCCPIRYSP